MKTNATHDRNKKILLELLKEPGNKNCAECGARGPLCWASVNLGIFFCTKCAGVHRGIGVHISFVRGVNLDTWEDKHMEAVTRIGNEKSNAIYEAGMPPNKKPNENSSPREIEEFIRQKYEKKRWVVRNGAEEREADSRSNNRGSSRQEEQRQRPRDNDDYDSRSRQQPQQSRQQQPTRDSRSQHDEPQRNGSSHNQQRPPVREQNSSAFANIRTSSAQQPPQRQPQKPAVVDLLAFGEPEVNTQSSKDSSLDDIFAGAFSTQDSVNEQIQQTKQHQLQQKINTQKSAQSSILNMFDTPMVPTSPHQGNMQQPFGRPNPMQMQQQFPMQQQQQPYMQQQQFQRPPMGMPNQYMQQPQMGMQQQMYPGMQNQYMQQPQMGMQRPPMMMPQQQQNFYNQPQRPPVQGMNGGLQQQNYFK